MGRGGEGHSRQKNRETVTTSVNHSVLCSVVVAESSDGCCLCGINCKISVGDFGRKKQVYFDLKGLELTKFA